MPLRAIRGRPMDRFSWPAQAPRSRTRMRFPILPAGAAYKSRADSWQAPRVLGRIPRAASRLRYRWPLRLALRERVLAHTPGSLGARCEGSETASIAWYG